MLTSLATGCASLKSRNNLWYEWKNKNSHTTKKIIHAHLLVDGDSTENRDVSMVWCMSRFRMKLEARISHTYFLCRPLNENWNRNKWKRIELSIIYTHLENHSTLNFYKEFSLTSLIPFWYHSETIFIQFWYHSHTSLTI